MMVLLNFAQFGVVEIFILNLAPFGIKGQQLYTAGIGNDMKKCQGMCLGKRLGINKTRFFISK